MKRRNFFAVLGAALLARKLPAQGAIGSGTANKIGQLFSAHKRSIDANAKALKRLNEALLHYAPRGSRT